jgi:hypothetical protein
VSYVTCKRNTADVIKAMEPILVYLYKPNLRTWALKSRELSPVGGRREEPE